jgi:hypothetical protein
MTPQEAAVVEAAKAWKALWVRVLNPATLALPEERNLLDAVRALDHIADAGQMVRCEAWKTCKEPCPHGEKNHVYKDACGQDCQNDGGIPKAKCIPVPDCNAIAFAVEAVRLQREAFVAGADWYLSVDFWHDDDRKIINAEVLRRYPDAPYKPQQDADVLPIHGKPQEEVQGQIDKLYKRVADLESITTYLPTYREDLEKLNTALAHMDNKYRERFDKLNNAVEYLKCRDRNIFPPMVNKHSAADNQL